MVSGSKAEGTVTGDDEVGGLIGYSDGNVLECNYNGDQVTRENNVGGLVGHKSGEITDSHAAGSVEGIFSFGGLVGFFEGAVFLWDDDLEDFVTIELSIADCSASGNVTGSQSAIGGLVGIHEVGFISERFASGTVTGTGVGEFNGVVGSSAGGSFIGLIEHSYATGAVSGHFEVGGLVGGSDSLSTVIDNSYATGNVTGVSNVGSLAGGGPFDFFQGDILKSYAVGEVTGDTSVGGLVGSLGESSTVENSYYDSITSKQSDTGKGIPKTTTEMQAGTPSADIYTDWSTAIWNFPAGQYLQLSHFFDDEKENEVTSVILSADPVAPQPAGSTIKLTAAADGTAGFDPHYEFLIRDPGGTWTTVQPYSDNDSYSWAPAEAWRAPFAGARQACSFR